MELCLVEMGHEVGTGVFLVVDDDDDVHALHIFPDMSEELAEIPWWL